MGKTSLGTPVYVNKIVAISDLVIGIGGILPHGQAGFGGGAKSDAWCQILSDVLERKIIQMEAPDLAAAKGSAIISMVGLKILNEFSAAIPLIKVKKVFTPNLENKKIYDKLFNEYVNIYKRNKKMFNNLNL